MNQQLHIWVITATSNFAMYLRSSYRVSSDPKLIFSIFLFLNLHRERTSWTLLFSYCKSELQKFINFKQGRFTLWNSVNLTTRFYSEYFYFYANWIKLVQASLSFQDPQLIIFHSSKDLEFEGEEVWRRKHPSGYFGRNFFLYDKKITQK